LIKNAEKVKKRFNAADMGEASSNKEEQHKSLRDSKVKLP
jgi:hypothetical protein